MTQETAQRLIQKSVQQLPPELSRYTEAHNSLKQLLYEVETANGNPHGFTDVGVYCFGGEGTGIRIDEISYETANGGCATMRCSTEAHGLLLAAEDYLLTFGVEPYIPEGWTSAIDEHADAKDRLLHHLETPNPNAVHELVRDLLAASENMLLHHGPRMSPADRSGRQKVVDRAYEFLSTK